MGITRCLGLMLPLVIATAEAATVRPPAGATAPCGLIERFGGNVQILSPDRDRVVEAAVNGAVECEGWISVVDGWVHVRHREGYLLAASEGTLLQVAEGKSRASDHVRLLRGEVLGQSLANAGELRVLTANGRMRLAHGRAVLLFREKAEETQVIGLGGSARLENRFQPNRSIAIGPGEGSSLNFRLLRTVPNAPTAVSAVSVREKLAGFHADEASMRESLREVQKRLSRLFASQLDAETPSSQSPKGRTPASAAPPSYVRHEKSAEDAKLHERLERSLAGGSAVSSELLHPEKNSAVMRKTKIQVRSIASGKEPVDEDNERARLLDELSRIRPGE